MTVLAGYCYGAAMPAAHDVAQPVYACVPEAYLSRDNIARCLGWYDENSAGRCRGYYSPLLVDALPDTNAVRIMADNVSLYADGRSRMRGNVEVQQEARMVNAKTAYVYRDVRTKQITRVELLGTVRYLEPGRLIYAKKVTLNPQDKSGFIEHALYRFDTEHAGAQLPAWGVASLIKRFVNKDILLRNATYSTCPPKDMAWRLEAKSLYISDYKATGVARDAVLRVGNVPLLYTPYLSFPTSKERKSGFLMPLTGYSNVGGWDMAAPIYWNMAPNYDAILTPHIYTRRGVMLGGNFRFLTPESTGLIGGNFLPNDKAYKQFLFANQETYPSLRGDSTNRWSFNMQDNTQLLNNLDMHINYQQVSDNYYLQDFSSNLAVMTENQLLRQGVLSYREDHWLLQGMLQSYQTLSPINQSVVANIYERLPQLLAAGSYDDLPLRANFNILGQFDYFRWPSNASSAPQGGRYHLNPILSFPQQEPGGYITPAVEVVENYYDLHQGMMPAQTFNHTIPRFSVDSGLTLERALSFGRESYTQTLEPRLYYLNVPYQNQSAFPAFDSAYMIFNGDQLFRSNRFSGFDRIGDTNQLSYALTTRFISEKTGLENANFSIGQISYFADRRVQLCYMNGGNCTDSTLFLGYLSPLAKTSPIASRAVLQLSQTLGLTGDYVWDTHTRATNNSNVNIHYQPATNQMFSVGYSYLVNGNVMMMRNNAIDGTPLHQATVAYALPLTEKWSTLGAYSQNLSEGYSMMSFFGLQYDTCCWAVRLLGGRVFQSLVPNGFTPQYNNNVYVQFLLKGLGSVANGSPASTVQSYLPGYSDLFQR